MECSRIPGWRLVIACALAMQGFIFHSQAFAYVPSGEDKVFLKGKRYFCPGTAVWQPSGILEKACREDDMDAMLCCLYHAGDPDWMPSPKDGPLRDIPTLIPKIIHRMDKSNTPTFNEHEDSWRRLNPGWTMKVWNDKLGLKFVRQAFPEYLDAYQHLGKNIERSDFFR